MGVIDYSSDRDSNANIAPGNIRSNDFRRDQQIINSIRQLMADLATNVEQASILEFDAVSGGAADDTTAVNNAIAFAVANGLALTGLGLTYGFTGKIVIPSGLVMRDATFKQLDPGDSLSVITLEADTKSNIDLRRVTVDRNGDGTNGGLLDASGTNGALNTAFGMKFISCTNCHFEDLECFGDDSGTGILFRLLDDTNRIIRPYAHDIEFARSAATDDNAQGLWFDQCGKTEVVEPRSVNITAVIGGSASRRWTRGLAIGGCTGTRFLNHYIHFVDQGFDITGGPTPNKDLTVSHGVSSNCKTYGVKLANTARRCRVNFCTTYDCGVGYVASANNSESSTVTTRDCYFINCVAFNTGSLGTPVVSAGGFRVLQDAATDAGRARDIWFINCLAVDEQGTATMEYGFMSEITAIGDAPWFINCLSIGHITAEKQGLWRTFPNAVGTVTESGGVHTGALMEYTTPSGDYVRKYADGIMEEWGVIDDTGGAWSTVSGSLFTRSALLSKTFPTTFSNVPTVNVGASRGDTGVACGVNIRDYGASSINLVPWTSISIGAGNAKYVHWHALGRWF